MEGLHHCEQTAKIRPIKKTNVLPYDTICLFDEDVINLIYSVEIQGLCFAGEELNGCSEEVVVVVVWFLVQAL